MNETPATELTSRTAGRNATDKFKERKASSSGDTPPERVSAMARELLHSVHDIVQRHELTYEEYDALKNWLIKVGEDGEWPLFLDVWVESAVERTVNSRRAGSKGSIEGPYYVPEAPRVEPTGALPVRPDERGIPLTFSGLVTDVDGTPLPEGKVEVWHADYYGLYSHFEPGVPEWNLRGTIHLNQEGRFAVRTIRPAAYEIPTAGACGQLVRAAGWHAWRPAHIHVKVSAPGYQLLTSQLYFSGDAHTDDDVASAVKDELLLDPTQHADGSESVSTTFALTPA